MPTDTSHPPQIAQDVLHFWFGDAPLSSRAEWFRKDAGFDDQIRQRFGGLVKQALLGPLAWPDDLSSRLAEILVLDQFPRNLFRGQARAFEGDSRACTIALAMIDDGAHLDLPPVQRWFAYLPLEHAEDLPLQEHCVALCAALASENPEMAGALDYAERHCTVIREFGRFPHRNQALGRASTEAELAYLRQPGSGF